MIKIYGSNRVKGHRGQRSNLCVFSVGHVMSYLRFCVCVCVCVCVSVCKGVSYLSSSPQSSYCYVETGKIY